jgi:hypothetical protein
VIKSEDCLFKYELPLGFGLEFCRRGASVQIKTSLFDKRRCGFVLWGEKKLSDPSRSFTLRITRDRISSLSECLWLEPYPRGARAAICLTDHADFDSVEKVQLLSKLFIKTGFKCTKSVFPQSEPKPGRNEPGLDTPQFKKVIDEMYEYGVEIAYHGFGPRRPAPPIEECIRRAKLMAQYQATTWIDHGLGSYLFSRQNILADGSSLARFLEKFNVVNFWSYADIWNNPFHNINCWRSYNDISVLSDALQGFRSMSHPRLDYIAYLGMHLLKNIFGEEPGLDHVRRKPWRVKTWSAPIKYHNAIRFLRNSPYIIYGQDGTVFPLNINGMWIFDTDLLNHLGIQLGQAMVDRLCKESGLLIGHCYFSDQNKYGFDNCFLGDSDKLRLNSSFIESLEYIAERQRQREVVSLSFAQLRESLVAFIDAKLIRNAAGWVINGDNRKHPVVIAGDHKTIAGLNCENSTKWFNNQLGYIETSARQGSSIALYPSQQIEYSLRA